MNPSQRRNLRRTLAPETLETRRLLVAFGMPWPDAQSLSISFPADGVGVHGQQNRVNKTLDAITDRQQWQELALRAFQTWAYHADINVGLRNDQNADFGTPGLTVGDPRFGEFRIGAISQSGALANTLPYQILAGTSSGDLLLNSDNAFSFHDWADGTAPAESSGIEPTYDLFSLLLHESGNAFGLADNALDWSVMFRNYTAPKGALTDFDIAEIQSLYGPRTDAFESTSNDSISIASVIPQPIDFDAAEDTVRIRGSLRDLADVDVYRFSPVTSQDSLTVRLNAETISLLKARVEVLTADGTVLGSAAAGSVFENDVAVRVDGLAGHDDLFVRVTSADGDVYSVGDYVLELDYRAADRQASDAPVVPYDFGVETLGLDFVLADDEIGENDSIASATPFDVALDGVDGSRFEILSAVGGTDADGNTDVDVWKLTEPTTASGAMKIQLSVVGNKAPDLRIRILDAAGLPVGASGRVDANGVWTLNVNQVNAGEDYFLRVSVDPTSVVDVGNYVATAEFTPAMEAAHEMISRVVSSDVDEFVRWHLHESKMYRFDLFAEGSSVDHAVKLTVFDAFTKEVKLVVGATSGSSRSVYAMLDAGDYIFQLRALSRSGQAVDSIRATLFTNGLSDDQDPGGYTDPDESDPMFDPYYYYGETDVPYQYYNYDPFGYDEYYSST